MMELWKAKRFLNADYKAQFEEAIAESGLEEKMDLHVRGYGRLRKVVFDVCVNILLTLDEKEIDPDFVKERLNLSLEPFGYLVRGISDDAAELFEANSYGYEAKEGRVVLPAIYEVRRGDIGSGFISYVSDPAFRLERLDSLAIKYIIHNSFRDIYPKVVFISKESRERTNKKFYVSDLIIRFFLLLFLIGSTIGMYVFGGLTDSLLWLLVLMLWELVYDKENLFVRVCKARLKNLRKAADLYSALEQTRPEELLEALKSFPLGTWPPFLFDLVELQTKPQE